MSGAMDGRAAVFTSSPQAVEVYAAGEWLPGSLLGWRHDATGGCQVRVTLSVAGTEESQWTGLERLRLPERGLAVAAAPVEDLIATRSLRLAEVSGTGASRRGRPAVGRSARPDLELTVTRGLPVVRAEVASRASHPAGRRRADPRVVGGTAEISAVGTSGRHRAPASSGSGRHRAADSGPRSFLDDSLDDFLDDADAAPERTPEEPTAEVRGTRVGDASPGRAGQPDLLTRPMRLDDLGPSRSGPRGAAPQPRGAREDALRGV